MVSRASYNPRAIENPVPLHRGPGRRRWDSPYDTGAYGSWRGMLRRCYGTGYHSYADYGGRGIAVCDRWRDSFDAFYADMGDRPKGHSLDRIDNDGDYSPENCRWADSIVQNNNRRDNHWITHGGKTLTIAEWARLLGIPLATLKSRIVQRRMTPAAALVSGNLVSPPQHGTITRYNRYRCRCEPCRAANTKYCRKWQAKRRAQLAEAAQADTALNFGGW